MEKKTCCEILRAELNPCQWYYSSIDSTGKTLDIPESFGPSSPFALAAKVALAGFAIYTWISMFVSSGERGFFFAYLTVWALSLQILYHLFSLWNSFAQPPGINTRVKITWFLYNLTMHTDILVALLWWGTVFDPDEGLSFNKVAPHSATAVVLLIEGFLVNRIPIRIYHWWGTALIMGILYPAWTIVHAILDVGNPNESDEDPETNDDGIYSTVDWKDDALGTAIFMIVVVLVVGPIIQLILFVLSMYSPCCRVSRRYVNGDKETNGSLHDMEQQQQGDLYADVY